MASVIPDQSGMNFIAENTFHIEDSISYANIHDKGVRSVEFVRIKNDAMLLFIEAKSSFPNPNNPSEENSVKFQNEISEVCEKFKHSLNLFSSIRIGVTKETLPDDFIVPETVTLVFVLVVRNHELKWCKPIKGEIETMLPHYLKMIWNPTVLVINQEEAAEQGLIERHN